MSKITVVEANYNDKETVKLLFTKGPKGDKGEKGEKGQDGAQSHTSELINDSGFITMEDVQEEGYAKDTDVQTAITTAITNVKSAMFPIGSIFFTAGDTNPSTFLGGTWEQIAEGQFVVGVGQGTDANDVTRTFTAGENVGEYEHIQTENEIATHSHTINDAGHTHKVYSMDNGSETTEGRITRATNGANYGSNWGTTNSVVTGITINNAGSSQAMNITNPSFGMYIWQRTA